MHDLCEFDQPDFFISIVPYYVTPHIINSSCDLKTDILGDKLSALIFSMIAKDYTKRPSAEDILSELNTISIRRSFDATRISSPKKEPSITTDKLSTGQAFKIITKKK